MTEAMYQIDYQIKINPTQVNPYELKYKVNILDEGFRERLSNLQKLDFVISKNSIFMGLSYMLTIDRFSKVNGFDVLVPLSFSEEGIIRLETENQARDYRKKLEIALARFLKKQQKEYVELLEKSRHFKIQ